MEKGVAVRLRRRAKEEPVRGKAQVAPQAAPARPGVYTHRDLARCTVIALIVGTALVIINVRPVPGEGPDLGRVFINYLVPFIVASSSAMLANHARIKADRKKPPRPLSAQGPDRGGPR